tara:strand:- start:89 stop:217 length:129 start_codon:yes stop_codon:yes gene_type:complete
MKYSEMYLETCSETGEKPTKKGYKEFKAWRERVEVFFERSSK